MQHNIFLLFLLLLLQTACSEAPRFVRCEAPCLDCNQQPCTKTYNHLTVSVRDQQGDENVQLDEYFTIHLATGDTISLMGSAHEEEMRRQVGRYPVVSDSQMKIIDDCGEVFLFVAEKDGKTVIREEYTVFKDCCHVSEIHGNTEVIVLGCVECPEKIFCHMIFVYEQVLLTDQIGKPVELDEHFTIRTSTQDTIRVAAAFNEPAVKAMNPAGTYLTISNADPRHPCVEEYIFVGLKDGKEVVREPLLYRQGCCGVGGGTTKISVRL